MSLQESVTRCIEAARAILSREGATEASLRAIGDEMQLLAQTPNLIATENLAPLHGSDATFTLLHSDGERGLTLMLASFPASAPTPVHDHNSWGVACVVAGRDRYQHFERLDDGTDHDQAHLRLLYERELVPGDVVVWTDPPHDIHCQQGIDGTAWELVLFGVNTMALPRHYFDLATGAVHVAMPR